MNNELMIINQGGTYSGLSPIVKMEKKTIFNATANPDYRLRECVNMKIQVVGIIVEMVEVKKEVRDKEGNICGEELVQAPRIVFIDKEGKSYTATSSGVFNAVGRILALFGEPSTWEEPLNIKPKLLTKGTYNILTLEVV